MAKVVESKNKAEEIKGAAAAGAAGAAGGDAVLQTKFDAPEGFINIETRSGMWKELSPGDTLLGYPISVKHIVPKEGEPFDGIIFSLTREAVAFDNDKEERAMFLVGEQVIVPSTYKMEERGIQKLGEHPSQTREVYLQFIEKKDIGKKSLNVFKMEVGPKLVDKSQFKIIDITESGTVAQLPQTNSSNGAASAPFPRDGSVPASNLA